jgi:hypothetical protein
LIPNMYFSLQCCVVESRPNRPRVPPFGGVIELQSAVPQDLRYWWIALARRELTSLEEIGNLPK